MRIAPLKQTLIAITFALLLSAAPAQASPDKHYGRATLTEQSGVYIMNLFGTRREMAYQHGYFVRDMVGQSALPYFAEKIHHTIGQTYLLKNHPRLAKLAGKAIDFLVGRRVRNHVPAEDRAVLESFAQGAGVPAKQVLNAQVVPDVGQWLTAKIFGDQRIGQFGCTTIVAHDGEHLHARNLDYESYGIFEKYPLVIYFHPDNPDELGYVAFTSMGLHTAGITGTNEAGLSLSLHQTFIDATSLKGTPILTVTDRVVREARTLQQAVEILQSVRHAGSWNVIVSSASERAAVSVEVSARGAVARKLPEPRVALTNHVFSPQMKAREFSPSYYTLRNSQLRLATVERGFKSRAGKFTLQDAIDLVSEGPVAKVNNVQSVVIAPDRGSAFVAVPDLPGSKPMDGHYVEVPLRVSELLDDASLERALASRSARLRPSLPSTPEAAQINAHYRIGAHLAADEGDNAGAVALIDSAGEPLMAGLTSLKAGQVAEGKQRLLKALEVETDSYRKSLIHLFLGRVYETEYRYDLARAEYDQVEERLRGHIGSHLEIEGYRAKNFRKLVVDYVTRDVFRF
jgi:hypothetical protein